MESPKAASIPKVVLGSPKRRRVLVVDDEESIQSLLGFYLLPLQCEVVYASNTYEALRAIEANPRFDLIITDIVMPGENGFALVRKIRANPVTSEIPILIISGNTQPREMESAMGGIKRIALMIKPIRLQWFREVVERGFKDGFSSSSSE